MSLQLYLSANPNETEQMCRHDRVAMAGRGAESLPLEVCEGHKACSIVMTGLLRRVEKRTDDAASETEGRPRPQEAKSKLLVSLSGFSPLSSSKRERLMDSL